MTSWTGSGYPTFGCQGYGTGTSGGPWLTPTSGRDVLVGLVGGLHQGGCAADVSYSPRFNSDTAALYLRATQGGAGDLLPVPGGDGC